MSRKVRKSTETHEQYCLLFFHFLGKNADNMLNKKIALWTPLWVNCSMKYRVKSKTKRQNESIITVVIRISFEGICQFFSQFTIFGLHQNVPKFSWTMSWSKKLILVIVKAKSSVRIQSLYCQTSIQYPWKIVKRWISFVLKYKERWKKKAIISNESGKVWSIA